MAKTPETGQASLRGPLNALANVHERIAKAESNPIYRRRRQKLVDKARELAEQEPDSEA